VASSLDHQQSTRNISMLASCRLPDVPHGKLMGGMVTSIDPPLDRGCIGRSPALAHMPGERRAPVVAGSDPTPPSEIGR
jgi:hypothetical protein